MTRKLFAVALLFAGTAALADSKSELKAMAGTWAVKAADIEGKDLTESFKAAVLTLDGDRYEVAFGNMADKGTLTVDGEKKPKTMDITGVEGPNRGKTFLCLYELKDDTLTVCYGLDFKTRPADFTTGKDSQRMKIVYTRKK